MQSGCGSSGRGIWPRIRRARSPATGRCGLQGDEVVEDLANVLGRCLFEQPLPDTRMKVVQTLVATFVDKVQQRTEQDLGLVQVRGGEFRCHHLLADQANEPGRDQWYGGHEPGQLAAAGGGIPPELFQPPLGPHLPNRGRVRRRVPGESQTEPRVDGPLSGDKSAPAQEVVRVRRDGGNMSCRPKFRIGGSAARRQASSRRPGAAGVGLRKSASTPWPSAVRPHIRSGNGLITSIWACSPKACNCSRMSGRYQRPAEQSEKMTIKRSGPVAGHSVRGAAVPGKAELFRGVNDCRHWLSTCH